MADAGRILIIPRGDYNANSTYEKLDLVKHKGTSWLAKKNVTGIEPTEGEYWQKIFDLGTANNLTTTAEGFALDARQGKALSENIESVKNDLVTYGYKLPTAVYDLDTVPINVRSTVFCAWGENESKPNKHNIIMETIPLTGSATSLQIAFDYDATVILASPLIFMRFKSSTDGKSEWIPIGGGKVNDIRAFPDYCEIISGGCTRNSINVVVSVRINVHERIPAYTNFMEWLPASLIGFSPLNCMKESGETVNTVYVAGTYLSSTTDIPIGEYNICGSYVSQGE